MNNRDCDAKTAGRAGKCYKIHYSAAEYKTVYGRQAVTGLTIGEGALCGTNGNHSRPREITTVQSLVTCKDCAALLELATKEQAEKTHGT